MEEVTRWIANNPVVSTWITMFSLFGVLITVIALIIQIKDKKRRAIYYTITSTVLVDNEVSQIKGIKILYQDKEIDTIAISKIKIWNGGNEILEETDFYPDNKLKIVVPEKQKILATTIIDETDDTCKMQVQISKPKECEAVLSFYCLEPHQGAIINVYHTNVNEEETKIIGKIKGGKVLNKSMEVVIEDGEVYMITDNYKIYFSNGILGTYVKFIKKLPNIIGISIIKTKKKKK